MLEIDPCRSDVLIVNSFKTVVFFRRVLNVLEKLHGTL